MAAEEKDLVIVGAGPSALAAAVYTTREEIGTVLYEKGVVGGLAAITDWIDNYPGFVEGIKGMDLASQMQGQAERFGAEIRYAEVTKIIDDGDTKLVQTTDGELRVKAILIATGSAYRQLNIPEKKSFTAAVCIFAQLVTAHSTETKNWLSLVAGIQPCKRRFSY